MNHHLDDLRKTVLLEYLVVSLSVVLFTFLMGLSCWLQNFTPGSRVALRLGGVCLYVQRLWNDMFLTLFKLDAGCIFLKTFHTFSPKVSSMFAVYPKFAIHSIFASSIFFSQINFCLLVKIVKAKLLISCCFCFSFHLCLMRRDMDFLFFWTCLFQYSSSSHPSSCTLSRFLFFFSFDFFLFNFF